MKRTITIGMVVTLLMALAMVLATSQSALLPALAAVPTSIPDQNAISGDSVGRSTGGIFKSGIAVEGDTDEVQLYVKPYANATANVMQVVNYEETPVFYVDSAGNVTGVGLGTFSTGATDYTDIVSIAAPTDVATATPALAVDSLGVSNLIEVRDAATPVWYIANGGAVVQTGPLTVVGASELNSSLLVGAPTPAAIPTWGAGDVVLKDDLEVQSDAMVAGITYMTGGGDLEGAKLDLDADNDTSITSDTDDQIDFELEGADSIVMKAMAGADAATTTNVLEIAGTTAINTTGTQEDNFLNIDMAIGNSSGGTNTVNAIRIDDISGDADVTETGIIVGTGLDVGLDLSGTPLDLDVDNDTSITASTDDQIDLEIGGADIVVFADAPDAGAGGDLVDITDAMNIMSSDTFIGLDMNLTNADHTGTSFVYGVEVTMTGSADAQAAEIGYKLGGEWDTGLDLSAATLTDDIVLQGGETIENATDGSVKFTDDGGNLLATVVDDGTTGSVNVTGGIDVQGGDLILQNDKRIVNSTASTINFTDGSNSLFTIVDAGSAGNATSTGTFTADGISTLSGAVTMESTLDVQGGTITMENDEVIDNSVDNAVTFTFATGATTLYGQPTAAASGDGVDLTQTLLVMDGSDVYSGIDMNLTNADQTGTSHIRGVDVNLDAADGQATESGFYVGGTWDNGLYLDDATLTTDIVLQNSEEINNDVDNAISLDFAVGSTTFYGQTGAAASGDGMDLTQTLLAMDGSDAYSAVDVNLTNATHAGSNTLRGLDLNLNTANANATEDAVHVGGAWDTGLDLNSATLTTDIVMQSSEEINNDVDNQVSIDFAAATTTFGGANAAEGSTDAIDSTFTLGAMNGSDAVTGFDLNLTNAVHTGSNTTRGVDVALDAAHAQSVETAYYASGAWDTGLNLDDAALTTDLVLQNSEEINNDVDNAISLDFAVGSTTFYGQPTVSESGDGMDLTQTLLAMDGSDVYAGLDMNLTNADQGGTSHVRGIDLNLNAADAQATESAAYVGGVWDYGVHLDDATLASGDVLLQNSLVLDGYTADNLKVTDGTNTLFTVTDAGTTGNGDFSGTLTVDGISTLTGAVAADGGITVDSTAFTVADTSGDVETTGTLDVTGLSTLSGGTTKVVNVENLMSPSVLKVPITYTAGAGGTITLATVGAGEIWVVNDVLFHVTTEWTDTAGNDEAVVIGTGEDTDGFCVMSTTQLVDTYAPATGFAEGWTCNDATTRGVFLDEAAASAYTGGFILESTETVDIVISSGAGDDITAGAADVYLIYTRLE